jgi:hypothetical protein
LVRDRTENRPPLFLIAHHRFATATNSVKVLLTL